MPDVPIVSLPDGSDITGVEFPGSNGAVTRRYTALEIASAILTSTAPSAVGTAAVGVATTAARADHVHAHGNQSGGALHSVATSGAAGFMSAADKVKLDAVEESATATPLADSTPAAVGTAAAGASASASRADHVHAHGTQAGGSLHSAATSGAAGFMSASDKTKLDGVEAGATASPLSDAVPGAVGSASAGVGTSVSRDDHTHAHGNQAGGSLHAAAIAGGAAGFMSGSDKSKLDGVEAAADVTDAANVAAAGAVMDGDFAGSLGALRKVGAGSYAVLQDNLTATVAPTVTDDSGAGYAPGSLWVDTAANNVYFCADAGVGAAVWRQIGAGGASDHGALTGLADDDHTMYFRADGTRAMTGSADLGGNNVTNVGTVDGRDVSADGTKLDGIESGADVTDATNVDAAGAVMESDFSGAQTILARGAGPLPSALTIPASRLIGRAASGDVAALTDAQVRALLGYPADEVSYDNATSGLTATNVQDAIDEVAGLGGGGLPTIRTVRGFASGAAAADRAAFERAGGDPFTASWGMTVLFAALSESSGEQRLCGTTAEFVTTGVTIAYDAPSYLVIRIVDNGAVAREIGIFDPKLVGKLLFVVVNFDATTGTVTVYINGALITTNTDSAAGAITPGGNFTVGAAAGAPGTTAAADEEIHGAAIRTSGVYTADEIVAWWRAIRDGGGIGSGPTGAGNEAWEATASTPSASAWAAAVGATALSRVGTAADPTLHNEAVRVWF